MQIKFDIKRFAIAILSCFSICSILFLSFIPVYAADYGLLDYNDYIASTEFDGTNDNVVVKFPSSLATIDFYRMSPTPETRLDQVESSSYTWSIESGNTYRFYGYPMGYSDSKNNNRLDLSNIPNGTNIHFDVTFHWGISDAVVATPYYSCIVFYYGDNGSLLSQTFWEGKGPGEGAPYDEDTWSFDLTIDKPDGAKSLLFYAQLSHMECYQSGDITVSLDNFSMDFSVSALYRLQEQTGKNSVVLSNIESELAEQGQTIEQFVTEQEKTNEMLGDIQTGTPEQGDKADQMQDEADDLNDQLEDAGNALGQLEKPDIEFEEFLPPELQGSQFRDLANTLSAFWEFDILLRFFMILGGIMFISFLLFGVK